MRKVLKYGVWFLAGLLATVLLLVIVAGLAIQTRPMKKKIAEFAETKAAEFLVGDISIGEIDGNFFSNLSLKNVLWMNENDTIAFFEELDAAYELRPLLNGELLIQNSQISKPYFYLSQNKDSVWNIQELIKTQAEDSLQNEETKESDFKITIANFVLNEGRIKTNAFDTIIPKDINHLNTELALSFSSEEQSLDLKDLSLQTLNSSLALEKVSFEAKRNLQEIQLRDFYLKTAQNKLEGEGNYSEDTLVNASANFESAPLELNEFAFFVPGINLPVSPTLRLKTEVNDGVFNADISIGNDDENIEITLNSENLFQYLNDTAATKLKYTLDGKVQNIDLARWLNNPELSYTVNGNLQVEGEGTDPKTATIKLDGDFRDLIIHEKPVDKLLASLQLQNGNLHGTIEGSGNFGTINITPEIQDLQGMPEYQLKIRAENFNLAEITGNDSLFSDINLHAEVKGRNFEPNKINAKAELIFSKSRFQTVTLDSLVAEVQYQNKNIQIDSLLAKTETVLLNAAGNYNLAGNSYLQVNGEFSGLSEFEQFIPSEDLFAEGNLNAHLKGKTDSLDLTANLDLKNVQYNDFMSEKVSFSGAGKITSTDTTFKATVFAEKFRTGEMLVDSVNLSANYVSDSVFIDGRVAGKDVNTNINAGVSLGDVLQITLNRWNVNYKNQNFSLQNAPATFEIDSTQYKISNFKLAANESDSAQFIAANGIISKVGNEDFEFEVANIDMQKIMEMLDSDFDASGIIDIKAVLKGTAEAPSVEGNFLLNNAMFNEFTFTDFSGDFGLQDNLLSTDVKIIPAEGGSLKLNGSFPFVAKLDSMNFEFDPKNSVDASLVVDSFPLAVLQNINIAKEIKGFLEGNVTVGGSLESPEPEGNFRLIDASLEVPEYGIDYQNISMNLEFLPEAVKLDSFYVKSEDGDMKANGTIDFSSAFYKGDISDSKIDVQFHNFNPVNHRQFNMQVSGDANLQGKKGEVVFGGDLNIPESEFYLPTIMNMMGKMSAPEIPDPILTRELKNMKMFDDSLSADVGSNQTDSLDLSYLDNFTGTLNLKIPKNTWIKNNDMHIEVSGDLELRKNSDFFELFGSVDVVRGQYELLGKTFIIDEGTINFQGGEEMMPQIDITATYTFRNSESVEQELEVVVSGTAEEPSVSFTLDDESVSEGDALSYILFGKSMNELSIDQQDDVSGSGSLAGSAAAAILSSQITNFLGDKLNVDYIEINSDGGSFDNATVVVGKYITNDLFVSYEQRFGETDETDMAKYEVKLEYELFKFLFLQLNNSSTDSGFDIIFKLRSKQNKEKK